MISRSSVFMYVHLQVKLPLVVFEVSVVDSLVKWGIHDSWLIKVGELDLIEFNFDTYITGASSKVGELDLIKFNF